MDNKDLNQIDKTIEEIRENLEHKDIKLESNKFYDQESIVLEKMLDKEIEKIKNKIKNSNPKWILEDFSEFINKKFNGSSTDYEVEVKIWNKKHARELGKLLKSLRGSNKDNARSIRIIWRYDSDFWCFKKYLENKIMELLQGWVFYYNTKIEYKKLKFCEDGCSKLSLFFDNILLKLAFLGMVLVGILGLIKFVIIIIALT